MFHRRYPFSVPICIPSSPTYGMATHGAEAILASRKAMPIEGNFALYELVEAVNATKDEAAIELLNTLISGKRLKDISDLPLDLAI